MKYIVFMLLIIYAAMNTFAQQDFPITLETVLQLSGANNLTVQEYHIKFRQALAEHSKSREWWLPDIYAGATTEYLSGAAMNTDGTIINGVTRNNLWAGLGISAEVDFSKGFFQSRASGQNSQASGYFSEAERNKAILHAVKTYVDLQAEQIKYFFLRQLADQADIVSKQVRIKVDAGLLHASDHLLAQTNSNHIKVSMLRTRGLWHRKSAELAGLLNLDHSIRLISADTVFVPVSMSLEPAIVSGFERRPEYSGLTSELLAFQTLRKEINQGLLLPRLRIGLDDGAFGAYNTPLFNTFRVNASLIWKLPLGRMVYQGDLKNHDTRILLHQNKIEQFKNQYNRELSVASGQLEILVEQIATASQALRSSAEALDQSIERQNLGTAKPFEVFQAQQFYLQSQVDFIDAVCEYNKAHFERKVALGIML
jgi:outer membrane protein TolC